MAGIDRFTGKPLDGWAHTAQSLGVLFTTLIGSRIMRRTVGSAVPALLGRSMTANLVLRFKTAIIVACELWEPRYKIIAVDTFEVVNTPEQMRQGQLGLRMMGEHRPRAHLGDLTSEGTRTFAVGLGSSISFL